MFQEILFPVDFSPRCQRVAPAVRALAQRYHAPVTLFHAIPPVMTELSSEVVSIELSAVRAGQKAAMERFLAQEFAGIETRREVTEGAPAHSIVERAARMEAPLIMMPTHGLSAFRKLLLGSVVSGVLHDADCAVWTTAHLENGGPIPENYRMVVCAIDLESPSAGVLRVARKLAEAFGATLRVVHSVPGIDPRFASGPASRAHALLVSTARDRYPKMAADAGVGAELEIVEDVGLATGIAHAANRHSADLLVIGRGAIQGVLGRLRSNAHELIRQSPCPVLSI